MKKTLVPLILLIILFSNALIFSQVKKEKALAPSFVAISSSAQALNTNTLNFTLPAGNNRLLLVFVTDEDASSIASVSFGAMGMTKQTEGTDNVAVDSVWTLTLGNSGTGTTANIVVLSTGGTPNESIFIGAVALAGVDQTTPVDGINQRIVTTANAGSSFNIPSEPGDMVFDYLDAFDVAPAAGEMQNPGTGQTQLHNADNVVLMGGGASRGYFQSSWRPGGSPNVQMSWTTTNDSIQHIAFNVNGFGTTAASVTIAGKVLTSTGRGIPNAIITVSDQNGNVRITRSNPFGYYRFSDIEVGETYIFSALRKGVTFANPTQVITVNDNLINLNFVSLP